MKLSDTPYPTNNSGCTCSDTEFPEQGTARCLSYGGGLGKSLIFTRVFSKIATRLKPIATGEIEPRSEEEKDHAGRIKRDQDGVASEGLVKFEDSDTP
jgi:hypothetical protein